jgi:hypothetical protein
LAIKDDDGLKRGVIISYNVEDDGGLPLVLAIAVRFASYSSHFFLIICVIINEFERQGGLVQVND